MFTENKQRPVTVRIVFPAHLQNSFTAGPALFGPLLHELKSQSVRDYVEDVMQEYCCSNGNIFLRSLEVSGQLILIKHVVNYRMVRVFVVKWPSSDEVVVCLLKRSPRYFN